MRNFTATNLKSVRDAQSDLRRYLKKVRTVPLKILDDERKRLGKEARAEVPYKTGKLQKSIRCSVSKSKKGATLNLSASARRGDYNYSVIQHENTKFKHPIKGKAFYLRDPFRRSVYRIKKALNSELGRP